MPQTKLAALASLGTDGGREPNVEEIRMALDRARKEFRQLPLALLDDAEKCWEEMALELEGQARGLVAQANALLTQASRWEIAARRIRQQHDLLGHDPDPYA
jgi:capsid protein